jgi:DNA-binding XRE family transcriptional regulator
MNEWMSGKRRERTQDFRRTFRAALRRSGTTQVELGTLVGVSGTTIGNWLWGKYVPDADEVFALEAGLDLSPGELSVHLGYMPVAHGSLLSRLSCHLLRSEEERALLVAPPHEDVGRNMLHGRDSQLEVLPAGNSS